MASNCCPLGYEVVTKMNRLIETGWFVRFNKTYAFHQSLKIARYYVGQNLNGNKTTEDEKEAADAANLILLANLQLFMGAFGGMCITCLFSFILECAWQYLQRLSGNWFYLRIWFYLRLITATEDNILVDILHLFNECFNNVILLVKGRRARRPV